MLYENAYGLSKPYATVKPNPHGKLKPGGLHVNRLEEVADLCSGKGAGIRRPTRTDLNNRAQTTRLLEIVIAGFKKPALSVGPHGMQALSAPLTASTGAREHYHPVERPAVRTKK